MGPLGATALAHALKANGGAITKVRARARVRVRVRVRVRGRVRVRVRVVCMCVLTHAQILPRSSVHCPRQQSCSVFTARVPGQLNIMDNAIGEEGAMALATTWTSAHVTALLDAVIPGYPGGVQPLFVDPKREDRAVITAIGCVLLPVGHCTQVTEAWACVMY